MSLYRFLARKAVDLIVMLRDTEVASAIPLTVKEDKEGYKVYLLTDNGLLCEVSFDRTGICEGYRVVKKVKWEDILGKVEELTGVKLR